MMQGTLGSVFLLSCCWVLHGKYDVQVGLYGALSLVGYVGLCTIGSRLGIGIFTEARDSFLRFSLPHSRWRLAVGSSLEFPLLVSRILLQGCL